MIPSKSPMSLLSSYKPNSTEELGEWLMMAVCNLKDEEGKRIYWRLDPFMAHQIASMMQEAKLEVPSGPVINTSAKRVKKTGKS